VKGFVARRPIWLNRPLGLDVVRQFAEQMEFETARFYRRAAQSARDGAVRDLLNRIAAVEDKHEKLARELGKKLTPQARATEDQTARRMFMLQYVQPGLAGLMDGSVSTLAPSVRGGVRHAQYLVDVPRRTRGLDRRRHLHGLRRGLVG